MNPICTITVEGNKAVAVGTISVGEKIDVSITGINPSSVPLHEEGAMFEGASLRFRIVDIQGHDLARFPLKAEDKWTISGNTFTANDVELNTKQLRHVFDCVAYGDKLQFGLILDSAKDAAQYARGKITLQQWSVASIDDPKVVPDWEEILVRLNRDLAEVDTAKFASEDARDEAKRSAAAARSSEDQAMASAQSAVEAANTALSAKSGAEIASAHYPKIGENGNWWVWDVVARAFVDTGYAAKGDKGDTPSLKGLATEEQLNAAVTTEKARAEAAEKDLSDRIARIKTMMKRVVDALPSVGEDDVLYLVPSQKSAVQNVRDEYLWVNGAWELIGSTAVDLSDYVKKDEVVPETIADGVKIATVAGKEIKAPKGGGGEGLVVDLLESTVKRFKGDWNRFTVYSKGDVVRHDALMNQFLYMVPQSYYRMIKQAGGAGVNPFDDEFWEELDYKREDSRLIETFGAMNFWSLSNVVSNDDWIDYTRCKWTYEEAVKLDRYWEKGDVVVLISANSGKVSGHYRVMEGFKGVFETSSQSKVITLYTTGFVRLYEYGKLLGNVDETKELVEASRRYGGKARFAKTRLVPGHIYWLAPGEFGMFPGDKDKSGKVIEWWYYKYTGEEEVLFDAVQLAPYYGSSRTDYAPGNGFPWELYELDPAMERFAWLFSVDNHMLVDMIDDGVSSRIPTWVLPDTASPVSGFTALLNALD